MRREIKPLSEFFLALFLAVCLFTATPARSQVTKEASVKENLYEVVYPLGRSVIAAKPLAPRLDTLEGRTICELWNNMFLGNVTFAIIEELLAKNYPGVKFVPYAKFGSTHGADEVKNVAALPKKLSEYGCNAVISGNGG